MKYAAVAGLSLMMAFSFNAVASDVYDCVYSKASLDNGKMGQMIGSDPAKIEYDGSSFKAYRPSGVALISPKLNSKQGSVTLANDGIKVFAVSDDHKTFAISDRIGKTTEQWDKCSSKSEVQNEMAWITYKKTDEMSDKVKATAAVSALGGQSTTLQFSCETGSNNIFMALIVVDEIITNEFITTRIDKNKANDMKVSVVRNTNGSAAFSAVSTIFLNHLMNGQKLLVRYGEYSKGGVTQTFTMNGLSDAISQIKSDCGI